MIVKDVPDKISCNINHKLYVATYTKIATIQGLRSVDAGSRSSIEPVNF